MATAWSALSDVVRRELKDKLPGKYLYVPAGCDPVRRRERDAQIRRQHATNRATGMGSPESVASLARRNGLAESSIYRILANPDA